MMKVTLRISSLLFVLISWSTAIWAQPANDNCLNALLVTFGTDEASAVLVNGDSRGATASTAPTLVCSGSWFTDDTWYYFIAPAILPDDGIVVKVFFDDFTNATDVPGIGMAIYDGCEANAATLGCINVGSPEDNKLVLSASCLIPGEAYYVRVWAAGADATTEGTFKVGVFGNAPVEPFLWCETFGGGIEANGWTTTGTCSGAQPNENGGFKYLPDGIIDLGAYAGVGYAVNGPTRCDGAVGVDSDFNDNGGVAGAFGTGLCPTPGQQFLVSPVLFSGDWNVPGLTLTWTQGLRQYASTYFISFRTRDDADAWTEWNNIPVNTEFILNSDFYPYDVQRFFMPGAAGHDSIQVRFVYNDDYYLWAIDDVKLVETECNNMRVQSNFYAIPPFVEVPSDQVPDFAALVDVYNAGACPQTNVLLNVTVRDTSTGVIVYNQTLPYGTIDPDSLAQNSLVPELIDLPSVPATYLLTYTIMSDAPDFNTEDNTINYYFSVGGDNFAHEDGFNRSVAVNNAIYDDGAPLSYAYGNIFRPEVDVEVNRIIWGINNPDSMANQTVSIYLIQWTDTNGDLIAEFSERRYVAFNDYTFTGSEGNNAILETMLINFDNEGEPIIMRAGFKYMALVEYAADDAGDPQMFLLANSTRDFTAQVLAQDSAFAHGLVDDRLFMTVLGFSPDGNIANIDYEVRELGDANRIYFGDNIVPLIRIGFAGVNTDDELPLENMISIYPNPASDEVQIKLEFTTPYDNVQLRLLNPLGQMVYEKVIKSTITEHTELIPVRDLTAGNYLLQVETTDGQRSIPVVVVK